MPAPRLSVVVTRRLPEVVETRMKELFDVELRSEDTPMTREELVAAMARADVLVPTLTDHIDANMLAQAGDRMRLIANYGAGVDHIDVASARQRGVLVSNTPGVVTEDTADITMALKIPSQAECWNTHSTFQARSCVTLSMPCAVRVSPLPVTKAAISTQKPKLKYD